MCFNGSSRKIGNAQILRVGSSLGKVFIVYVHFREEDGIVWVIHPPWHMCKSHPNFVVVVWMHISIVA